MSDDDKKDVFSTDEEIIKEIQKEEPDFNLSNIYPFYKNVEVKEYKSITCEDIEGMTPMPIEFVFYPCLPKNGIAAVYAATGVGKTLFTLNIAYAIAIGGDFLKYSCPKPRKVLYVDGEMPLNQLIARVKLIQKDEIDQVNLKNLVFLNPETVLPHKIPKIDDENGQNTYKKIIEENQYEVIVFDNISVLSAFDENKAHEWEKLQNFFLELRAQGITVIFVHHAGKDKTGYRGSSKMLDCVDVAISLQAVNDDYLEEDKFFGKKFKIIYHKIRHDVSQEILPFEVTLKDGQWGYQSVEKSELDKIVELYRLKMNQRDIAKDLNLSLSKVNRLIKKARQLRLLSDE